MSALRIENAVPGRQACGARAPNARAERRVESAREHRTLGEFGGSLGGPSAMEPLPRNDDAGLSATRELLPRARAGDRDAQGELLARYQRPLERFLHARLPQGARSLGETQDLVQEVFSRALESLAELEYRGVGAFWSFLRTIGARYVVDLSRRRSVRRDGDRALEGSSDAPADLERTPLERLVGAEQMGAFERALSKLSARSREALLLRLELDLDFAAIAGELEFPSPDAARMAVARAIKEVGQEMSRGREDD